MNFNRIRKVENGDLNTICELKNSGKKIYIYGCGAYAEAVCRYLIKNELTVEGYFVDHIFYRDNFYISGLKVNDIDDYADKLDDYNIAIGFCEINKTKFLIQNKKIVKGNYFLIWGYDDGCIWDEGYLVRNNETLSRIFDELADERSRSVLKELAYARVNHTVGKLIEFADSNQYFNELTFEKNSSNEVYVDCGAFNGDTIVKYKAFTNGKYKKIYAFEPDKGNLETLKNNTASFANIEIINKGIWDKDKTLSFNSSGSGSCISESGDNVIEVTTIDSIVKDDKVTFIKMDVEGSELEALHGAKETIRKNSPKLAICCYHKENDIIDLYTYIKSFDREGVIYNFYLRHHSNGASETVLYAIPQLE